MDRRSTAQITVRLGYAVPGVASVTDRLEYAYDDVEVLGTGMIA
ncbi:hypothetical protein AAH979_28815 [Plantactinospora sp. ZYX-F-223]